MKLFHIFSVLIFLFSLCITVMADNNELQWQELEVKTTVTQADGSPRKYQLEIESRNGIFRQIELESRNREWEMSPAQLQTLKGCSLNTLKIYADPQTGIRFTLHNPVSGKTFSCAPSSSGLVCTPVPSAKQTKAATAQTTHKKSKTDNGKRNTDQGISPATE